MIAVIDITGNNLTSLGNALKRLDKTFIITHEKKKIQAASHVILPGVGRASIAMQALEAFDLIDTLKTLTQPLLGICLGMQLLLDFSEEDNQPCLGFIPGSAKKIPALAGCPVPHMGWNQLNWLKDSSLKDADAFFYFVHSFAMPITDNTLASCQYSHAFSAIIQKDNKIGMQFHPEKSDKAGLMLLNNFLQEK